MKEDNVIVKKSYDFAVLCVMTYQKIVTEKREWVLPKQFLKSATSIGANVEESIGAQSRADFISKLSIAYKEARETDYWIRLMKDTDYIEGITAQNLSTSLSEILKIIGKIQITSKLNN
jgi:four helix bundle protein